MEVGNKNTPDTLGIATLWIASLIIVGLISFFVGRSATSPSKESAKASLGINTFMPTNIPQPSESSEAEATVDLETSCEKTGPSQQKDYLVAYVLKEGDTLQSIAEKELGDATRVNEIITLNENQKNLLAGATIYLPPASIKSSSGHIAEISGKIVKKDNASWQLTYGGGEKGLGVWIPGYYFKDVPALDSFQIGDCVTILMDNGVKVYSVRK